MMSYYFVLIKWVDFIDVSWNVQYKWSTQMDGLEK